MIKQFKQFFRDCMLFQTEEPDLRFLGHILWFLIIAVALVIYSEI